VAAFACCGKEIPDTAGTMRVSATVASRIITKDLELYNN
jgi:hypothetical protein